MLKKYWQNWASKRFKFEQFKQLTQKDILIFIYQQGYLFLVLIFITFIAGVNYANNLILGFCFLIGSILCMSFYLTLKQLHGLEITSAMSEVGQVGNSVQLTLYFQQNVKQNRYLWIKTDQHLEKILIQNSKEKITLNFYTNERGKFQFPNVQIYAVYPFGLVRAWTYLYLKNHVWIAPKSLEFQTENKYVQQNFSQDVDDFRELRDYQSGDSLHAVSWKHAARGQGLYVKIFEQFEEQHHVNIVYEQMPANSHEERLSLIMGLVEHCEQFKHEYSLILPHCELEKGVGNTQLLKAKLLLAKA